MIRYGDMKKWKLLRGEQNEDKEFEKFALEFMEMRTSQDSNVCKPFAVHGKEKIGFELIINVSVKRSMRSPYLNLLRVVSRKCLSRSRVLLQSPNSWRNFSSFNLIEQRYDQRHSCSFLKERVSAKLSRKCFSFGLIEGLHLPSGKEIWAKAVEIHAHILRRGFLENDVYLGSALISLYSKCEVLGNSQ